MLTGRSHPLLVHLPIGILMVAFLLAVLSRYPRMAYLKPALPMVLLAAAVSAVFSCIAGYLLSGDGGYEEGPLQLHMWLGIGVAVISIILFLLYRYQWLPRWQLPLMVFMLLLVSAAGHYGGSLTHGDEYLVQALPPGLQKLTGSSTGRMQTVAYTSIADARVYEDLVRPVLENRCYGCHNAQKLKGGLRLESVALIRKGGENGPVLKDSIPEESELYKRLVLPENDEHRMPPKGKPQLTPQELELLYWWIASGAPEKKTTKELHKTSRIRLVLEGMQPTRPAGGHDFVPETEVTAAAPEKIRALEAKGIKVMPIAADNHYLTVSCVNASSINDRDMQLLLPLKDQLIWLDLSGTRITDSALAVVSQLPHLTRLELKGTAINGSGLRGLSACKELRYLNLAGTVLTSENVLSLSGHKKLQQVYLYRCGLPAATIQQLAKSLKGAIIDTGGYRLPSLASDTIIYKKAAVFN